MSRKFFCRKASRASLDTQALNAAAEEVTAAAFKNVLRFNFAGERTNFLMLI
jgi:hypothetical protein